MKKLLMCPPTQYDIDWEINPWMNGNIGKVDTALAYDQWLKLYVELCKYASVNLIPQEPNLRDMVFTANAGYVKDKTVFLSRFNTHQRAPEEDVFRTWFLEAGYTVIQQWDYSFEGAGDCLEGSDGKLFCGYGYRTRKEAYNTFSKTYPQPSGWVIKLIDPRFYHLDTCFCPLDGKTIMYYDGAISPETLHAVNLLYPNQIVVSEEEAKQFACNAVVIGKNVFMPRCFSVADRLYKLGFEPHLFDMSEFIKAGGACKCLTLEI